MTKIVSFEPDRDDDALYDLFDAIVEVGEGFPQASPLTRPDYDAVWRHPDATVFVARDADGLLGAYYLKPNQPGRAAHIANAGYMVAAPARGTGLGRRLVAHSIDAAPGLGYDAIQFNLVFESNPARAMYEDLGWREIGRVPDAVEGETAIIYWRRVSGRAASPGPFTRFIGIDWSGARNRAEVWVAEAVAGDGGAHLQTVRSSSREDVERVLMAADRVQPTLVGADFAFSFPADFELGGRDDWTWTDLTEWALGLTPSPTTDALAALEKTAERDQFRLPVSRGGQGVRYREGLRATDAAAASNTVFNLVGARQVGLGSIHGMAMLERLRGTTGLAVWPFDPVEEAAVVLAEVYPKRWLDPTIRKSRREDRLRQVALWREDGHVVPPESAALIEASDDALDAAAAAIGLALVGKLPDRDLLPPEAEREGWILGVPVPSPR